MKWKIFQETVLVFIFECAILYVNCNDVELKDLKVTSEEYSYVVKVTAKEMTCTGVRLSSLWYLTADDCVKNSQPSDIKIRTDMDLDKELGVTLVKTEERLALLKAEKEAAKELLSVTLSTEYFPDRSETCSHFTANESSIYRFFVLVLLKKRCEQFHFSVKDTELCYRRIVYGWPCFSNLGSPAVCGDLFVGMQVAYRAEEECPEGSYHGMGQVVRVPRFTHWIEDVTGLELHPQRLSRAAVVSGPAGAALPALAALAVFAPYRW